MTVQDILKPADIIAVRTPGLAAELIRVGEELQGKPGLVNHIALVHHFDSNGAPWGLEGRPGGVGWVDLRGYLQSPWTANNCGQPGRTDEARAEVTKLAEHMLRSEYDWAGIADDTLRAFHMHDLFASTFHGVVPGHVVCSSFSAFLYERAGWERPDATDRDTEPSDWLAFIVEHSYDSRLQGS